MTQDHSTTPAPNQELPAPIPEASQGSMESSVAWLRSFVGEDPNERWATLGPLAKIAADRKDLAALEAMLAAGASPWSALETALNQDDSAMWETLAPFALTSAEGLDHDHAQSALEACAKKGAVACFESCCSFVAQLLLDHQPPPQPARKKKFSIEEKTADLSLARFRQTALWESIAEFHSPEVARMVRAAATLGVDASSTWSASVVGDAKAPIVGPLTIAASAANPDLVQALIDAGAEVGRGAFISAVWAKSLPVAQALARKSGHDGPAQGWEASPLEEALDAALLDMARLFLDAGADPNALCENTQSRNQGKTLLQALLSAPFKAIAGCAKPPELCAALLAAGADPLLAPSGESPLQSLSHGNIWGHQIEMRDMMLEVIDRRRLVQELRDAAPEPSRSAPTLRI